LNKNENLENVNIAENFSVDDDSGIDNNNKENRNKDCLIKKLNLRINQLESKLKDMEEKINNKNKIEKKESRDININDSSYLNDYSDTNINKYRNYVLNTEPNQDMTAIEASRLNTETDNTNLINNTHNNLNSPPNINTSLNLSPKNKNNLNFPMSSITNNKNSNKINLDKKFFFNLDFSNIREKLKLKNFNINNISSKNIQQVNYPKEIKDDKKHNTQKNLIRLKEKEMSSEKSVKKLTNPIKYYTEKFDLLRLNNKYDLKCKNETLYDIYINKSLKNVINNNGSKKLSNMNMNSFKNSFETKNAKKNQIVEKGNTVNKNKTVNNLNSLNSLTNPTPKSKCTRKNFLINEIKKNDCNLSLGTGMPTAENEDEFSNQRRFKTEENCNLGSSNKYTQNNHNSHVNIPRNDKNYKNNENKILRSFYRPNRF